MQVGRAAKAFGRNHAWAACAIVLGAWESSAYVSKRRIPTVSWAAWRAQERYNHRARVVILAWLTGLAFHLLRYNNR